jgi:hypothetical protein
VRRQRFGQRTGRAIERTGGLIDPQGADTGVVTVNEEQRARVLGCVLCQNSDPLR